MDTIIWNEDRMERLEELYRGGKSFALIAAEIGTSRNSVIGKAHRMRLPKRDVIAQQSRAPRPPPPVKPVRIRKRAVVMDKPPNRPVAIPGHDYSCTIIELVDASCRYPLWEFNTPHEGRRYCGIPEAMVCVGVSYCRGHAVLCGTSAFRG